MTRHSHPTPSRICCALALALCSWLPRAANAKIVAGPDIGNAFLPMLFPVSLAVLEDGSFALSGTTIIPAADGDPEDARAQFAVQTYSPWGRPLGAPFLPQLAATPPADNGGIGSLGDHYFVSWQHHANQTSRATMLGKGGRMLTAAFAFPNSAIDFYGLYDRYGHAPTWHFLPSFYFDAGTNPVTGDAISQASVQAYSAAGKPAGMPADLGPRPGWVFIDDLAVNGDGTFVVASQRCAEDFSSCAYGVEVFKPDGRPLAPFSTLGVPSVFYGAFALEVAPSGQFILVWGTRLTPGTQGLTLRLFDRQGMPASDAIALPPPPPGGVGFSQVKVRRHGNDFVLSWALVNGDGSDDFYLAEFFPASRRLSPPMLIAHSYSRPQPVGSNNLSAAGYNFELNDSGHGIVAWSTLDENFVFTGHLRLISVEGDRGAAAANGDRGSAPDRQDATGEVEE
ncbi:MAG TPA: hypothetical protein VMW75_03195 [Thermoanaerobaculia bacterium]|nr:hypothetical protein [Thermoanaerobaculia bacterium]